MKNTKHGQSGFTLIELVVVIVILGILAATALPKFVDMSGDARKAATQGVAGALASASSVNYAANIAKGAVNGTTFASATDNTSVVDTGAGCDNGVAQNLLQAGVTFAGAGTAGSYRLSAADGTTLTKIGDVIDCYVVSNDDQTVSAKFTLVGAK